MFYRPASLVPFFLLAGCAILLALLTAAAARRGLPRVITGSGLLLVRHNPVFRWFTLMAAVLVPAGLTILLVVYRPTRQDVPYLISLYLFFAGLTTLLVWEAGRFYVLTTPTGLEGRSAWRGTTVIRWDDFEAMLFRPFGSWFEFVGIDRVRIRAHTTATGIPELLRIVETRAPVEYLKPARPGYARIGRTFPPLPDEPVLEARPPRRVGAR
jgi:hypothetical protein